MPIIILKTVIQAPIEICFDLSRSIDLHIESTSHTNEQAVAGKISGLIGLNEAVTWKARHFGVVQTLTTRITEYRSPWVFVDEMEEGIFKRFRHEHHFTNSGQLTIMTDIFDYESPFQLLGKLADLLLIKRYMTSLLKKRNQVIKVYAESNKWKGIIHL
ncbi:SRPBCC family protein [Fulvivirga ulvae]|uniref:SRPBCC family protein n=1 Tax=Fulvivirga ulvae TaxID=2904245 RepID=UPI001F2FB7E8|nr:SRPBCC family protein [Fulvivirga ulvae]UII30765.1 SRPBCC family protein [Fulvivirga ulvae]